MWPRGCRPARASGISGIEGRGAALGLPQQLAEFYASKRPQRHGDLKRAAQAPHTVRGFFARLQRRQGIAVEAAERIRRVGVGGAKGSCTIYRITDAG